MAKIFSNGANLGHGKLFDLIYDKDFASSIEAIAQQQMTLEEATQKVNSVFEDPNLPPLSLLDEVRKRSQPLGLEHRDTLQSFIQERQAKITPLTTKISETLSAIGRLSRELSEASVSLAENEDQIRLAQYLLSHKSTAQRLQQDVLERIFLTCYLSNESINPNVRRAPLQLAAVCLRWREIALSMQTLWQYTQFTPPYVRNLLSAQLWSQRCRYPYLSLSAYYPTDQAYINALSIIRDPSTHVRGLDLGLSNQIATEFMAVLREANIDELEEVLIAEGGWFTGVPFPRLKRFYSYDPPHFWVSEPPPSTLTDLVLMAALHPTFVEYIFVHCPNLQRILVFVGDHGTAAPQSFDSGRLERMVLPNLIAFGLCNVSRLDLPPNTFSSIDFPNLYGFEYSVKEMGQESLQWLTLQKFLPRIRQLTLHLPDLTPTSLMSILSASRSVEELTLFYFNRNLLPQLIDIPSTSPHTVPLLRQLHFVTPSSFSSWAVDINISSLHQLAMAWSPSTPRSTHHLTSLYMSHWDCHSTYNTFVKDYGLLNFMSELESLQFPPGLQLQVGRIPHGTVLYSIPATFTLYRPPVTLPRDWLIFQPDRTWKNQ
ncbi:hypothetical protein BDN72DRAFT_964841 [Pluteus cervinus]|uniref:Uncharacterized protein n=1 Tax=Pluteus cervinus TaxID=181527 RepID=A0ACD3A801_9AGAR|nr:hypothetical protein BDN72DRAFT_964841 [Pluteus cervinus]